MKRWMVLPALLLALGGAAGVWFFVGRGPDPSHVYLFDGLEGPETPSRVVAPPPARIADHGGGGTNRLSILVTDPASDWLGLVRAFRAQGVPISVTTDPAEAMRRKVVLVYPIVSGRVLPPEALRGLAAHVRGGGTVLASDLAGGGLEELFGVAPGGQSVSRVRQSMTWTRTTGVGEEDVTRVGGPGEAAMPTLGYGVTRGEVVARYDDGAAAIVCRTVGGRACLVGVDLGAMAARAMNGRGEGMGRQYVNGYEPSLDVLLRWVRDQYVAGEPMPWLLGTVPAGRDVTLLLTHDVDYGKSVPNAQAYADLMTARGIKGTFFVQTKYLRDYNDEVFFDAAAATGMRRLQSLGMEVASHTVAHSAVFKDFPLGSGEERYPDYRPFVETRTKARGASIFGELRVSKFLLEHTAGARVVSFRPGELSYPFALPQALAATGYRNSSSITANSTLTHLPFQLTQDRKGAALVPVYEFPVTIEDEEAPSLGKRFDAANAVVGKIARHGGVAVILIHPNITGEKLDFERRMIDAWSGRAWIGPVGAFGDWWAARDRLQADVVQDGGRWVVTARSGQPVKDLVILTPKAARKTTTLSLAGGQRTSVALD